MRRLALLAVLVALTLGVLAPSVAQAQTGTPASGGSTGSFGIPLGTAVPWVGPDGAQLATISVTNITDPFQGYDPSYAPNRGYHYALADVTVTNTSSGPIDFDPTYLVAIDNDGFVSSQAYVTFSDPAVTQMSYATGIAPGASVSGVIPYPLFGDATVQRMAYNPSYDRFVEVLDLRTAPVAAGTPVSIMGTDGSQVAQVTVIGVTAPFTGYDSASAPPRGSSYVALEVEVTNTGAGVLSVSPSDFWAIDRDGFVLTSAYVTRTDTTIPDYTYIDLNPGESQRGILIYPIFADVPLAQVNYGDGYTSINVVADLSAGTGAQTTTAAPTASAPGLATTVPTVAAVPSNPDCEGLVEWGLDLSNRISAAGELTAPLQAFDVATGDPATLTGIAAQLRTYGDEQAAVNIPPAAAEVNSLIVEQFYYKLATALETTADALVRKDQTAAMVGLKAAQDVQTIFSDGGSATVALEALTQACPNEIEQLNNQGN